RADAVHHRLPLQDDALLVDDVGLRVKLALPHGAVTSGDGIEQLFRLGPEERRHVLGGRRRAEQAQDQDQRGDEWHRRPPPRTLLGGQDRRVAHALDRRQADAFGGEGSWDATATCSLGTRTSKVVPSPTVLRTEIFPPSFCTTAWQTLSPMPVPMPTGLV